MWTLTVDGGGSKCKARLENANGQLLAEAVAGPANPATDFAQTTDSILSACQRVLQQAGYASAMLAQSHVVLGLAGGFEVGAAGASARSADFCA